MKYEDFCKLAKPGDLIAISHQEWHSVSDVESQIVRIVTESEYSHIAVISPNKEGHLCILEAVVPAVVASPLDKYAGKGFYWIPTQDKPMCDKEQAYGLSKVGEPYSKAEAVAGFFDLIKIADDSRWFCAELTIAMRELSGLNLGDRTTPAAVVQSALAQGYTLNFITKE